VRGAERPVCGDEASGRIDKVGIALGDGWKLVDTQKGLQGREQFVLAKKSRNQIRNCMMMRSSTCAGLTNGAVFTSGPIRR
jgi:hypothetical protein